MIEHDAMELAKLTPAAGWGALGYPSDSVYRGKPRAEYEAMFRRAYRQLVEHGGDCARRGDETHQQWADRLGEMNDSDAKRLFHTMRVAYLNLEAMS